MIAVANRDPEQFPDPDRLDLSRGATGQLALGLGRSSCAGAWLVRAVLAAATSALLRRFASVKVLSAGPEIVRTGFRWSGPVRVRLSSAVDQIHEAMPTRA
jgi:cytochrome P450